MALKETLWLRAFGLLKIPLIAYVRPRVVEMTDERTVVEVPLTRRSRNHLGTMYLGALAIGADVAGGAIAMKEIERARRSGLGKVTLVFKDMRAEFLRRADGDVHFACEDGRALRDLVERAVKSGEREEATVTIVATVPKSADPGPVARFALTLSLKRK